MDGILLVMTNLGMKHGHVKTSGNKIRGHIVWGRNVRGQNIYIVET
jgi:hypothetical protein